MKKQGSIMAMRIRTLLVVVATAGLLVACETPDPHVVEDGKDLRDDPTVLSPPIVMEPLYACSPVVRVQGFIPDAKIEVFIDGQGAGTAIGNDPAGASVAVTVNPVLERDMIVTATQTFDSSTSGASDAVTVRSHTEDYPNGVPKPRIDPPPLYQCGKATGFRDVVEGSTLRVSSEPAQSGGFGPAVEIGKVVGSGAAQWLTVTPDFDLGDRVAGQYQMCSELSPVSDPLIVQTPPPTIPAPMLDEFYENQEVVTVRNLVNGGVIEIFANGNPVGKSPTPGGAGGQLMRIDPPASPAQSYTVQQSLCTAGPLSPPVSPLPCSEFPAAKIAPPQAGDTRVTVTEFVTGSRIHIYADGTEIGDGGGPEIQLNRPLRVGEQVIVVQSLGDCQSRFIYVIDTECHIPKTVSNPSGSGLYAVGQLDYSLPAVTIGVDSVRLWATVRYPAVADGTNAALIDGNQRLPLVVFLHGNHGIWRDQNNIDHCGFVSGATETPNHEGYNYILDDLARAGFVAVSINANDLNCLDDRILQRAQLIERHLALWKGMHLGTAANDPFGGKFMNRIDLERVGLFGHSRGGEAVVRAAVINSDPDITIRGVLSLAPTDAHSTTPARTSLLMVLPGADGDVVDLDGARIYDRAPRSTAAAWFKSQFMVYGANHNYFNEQWLADDYNWAQGAGPGPNRLSRGTQEAMLRAWARAFFELTVTGKEAHRPLFSRDAIVQGLLNDRLYVSYIRNRAGVVDDYEQTPDDITENTANGQVDPVLANFGVFDEFDFTRSSADVFNNSFFEATDGHVIEWKDASAFASILPAAAADNDDFENLSVRLGQVADGLGAAGTEMNIRIGIEDTDGDRIDIESVSAGRIAFPYQHPFGAKSLIHTLRFPRACFIGKDGTAVDFDRVKAVHFGFDQTREGTLALDQIEFTD